MSKERPILMSAEMVRAILEGWKTQTRRPMKPQPRPMPPIEECSWVEKYKTREWWSSNICQSMLPIDDLQGIDPAWKGLIESVNPFGKPGDRLWVRETALYKTWGGLWTLPQSEGAEAVIQYGDYSKDVKYVMLSHEDRKKFKWGVRPSIHMPRWASRLTLEITEVRVERLNDITEEDARAEGCREFFTDSPGVPDMTAVDDFIGLWSTLYKSGPNAWDANPWVWVVSFKVVKP